MSARDHHTLADWEAVLRERIRITRAALALVLTVLSGTAGFMWIEDWSAWDGLYFTLITITTVGYGENGLSPEGRKFAAVLLVFGLSASSYAFAVIVQSLGQHDVGRKRRMQKRIDALSNHTIICGFGRMGRTIAEELHRNGREFVIVDDAPEMIRAARDDDYATVCGSASEDEVMESAGIARAETVVAAVGLTSTSILVAITARGMSPTVQIIARAERDEDERKLRRAGATRIVSPYTIGGHEVATAIMRPAIADFLAGIREGASQLILTEVQIDERSPLVGRKLSDYGRNEGREISFVAIRPKGRPLQMPVSGDTVLCGGELLMVAGDGDAIDRMRIAARPAAQAA